MSSTIGQLTGNDLLLLFYTLSYSREMLILVPAGLISNCRCPLDIVPLGVDGTGLGAPVLMESNSRSCLILLMEGDLDELKPKIIF